MGYQHAGVETLARLFHHGMVRRTGLGLLERLLRNGHLTTQAQQPGVKDLAVHFIEMHARGVGSKSQGLPVLASLHLGPQDAQFDVGVVHLKRSLLESTPRTLHIALGQATFAVGHQAAAFGQGLWRAACLIMPMDVPRLVRRGAERHGAGKCTGRQQAQCNSPPGGAQTRDDHWRVIRGLASTGLPGL